MFSATGVEPARKKKASKAEPRDERIKQEMSRVSHLDPAWPETRPPPDFSVK